MRSLKRMAAAKGWRVVNLKSDYDALLVNGEGSMHHGSRAFQKKMQLLREAVENGKPTYLVNTVWQENPANHDDVLKQLSGVSVREVLSQSDLLERHGIRSRVVTDVSASDAISRFCLRKNLHGRPALTDFWIPDQNSFGELHQERGTYLPLADWSWSRIVSSLRTAGHLITGRQHAVFASCVARTPFLASEGNSHKIRGLLATAGAQVPVAEHPNDIPELRDAVAKCAGEYRKLFDFIKAQDYSRAVPFPGEVWFHGQ